MTTHCDCLNQKMNARLSLMDSDDVVMFNEIFNRIINSNSPENKARLRTIMRWLLDERKNWIPIRQKIDLHLQQLYCHRVISMVELACLNRMI